MRCSGHLAVLFMQNGTSGPALGIVTFVPKMYRKWKLVVFLKLHSCGLCTPCNWSEICSAGSFYFCVTPLTFPHRPWTLESFISALFFGGFVRCVDGKSQRFDTFTSSHFLSLFSDGAPAVCLKATLLPCHFFGRISCLIGV